MNNQKPNFTLLIELLKHNDHNYNYFAASKLKSIINILKSSGNEQSINDLML